MMHGTEVSLRPNMRFLSLTCVVVLLAVGVALSFGTVEESQEAHLRVRRGTGCPDMNACMRSCQSEGKRGGVCLPPYMMACMCF
ncbi:defensin-like [Dermacentor albipictus]|uniref:defensin-like n=1 Tax=Dermacentor albipictus TaxID=60249 RepID=UPI0031FBA7B8